MPLSATVDLQTLLLKPQPARPAGKDLGEAAVVGEWQAPLQRLLRAVLQLARARAGTLRLLDPSNGALLLVSAVGEVDTHRLDLRKNPGGDCGVCSDALRMDQARCAAASCACARAVAESAPAPSDREERREERVFVLPLHHGAAPCGVLNLFFDRSCEVPSSLQALLPAMGDMLGLALENHRLARRALQDGVTLERLMLAGEVHDSLAQSLTWARMRLSLLRAAIDQGDRVAAERYLKDIDGSLVDAHARMRELISDFRTRMHPQGLLQGLQQVAEQLGTAAGLQVVVVNQADDPALGAEQELQVFHILREALSNVAKHARARLARVTLSRSEGRLCFSVEDDGVGLESRGVDRRDHFGLDLMRERARLIGGRIELLSRSGSGTTLLLSLPDPQADLQAPPAKAAHG
ncbi:MAG: GAF domain-containing protein [Leptothrix sp. (in: Bacteria)]|nr:GAF domain-containing protein [Leptothrix sp. (in: b-proteobacteria)]MBP7520140.1 GAF domain-containing protein [Leptothrix sp. (in: b-proteobacteria)]HQY10088.1 histidine kinase [Burkholderiaceae bacterium]